MTYRVRSSCHLATFSSFFSMVGCRQHGESRGYGRGGMCGRNADGYMGSFHLSQSSEQGAHCKKERLKW